MKRLATQKFPLQENNRIAAELREGFAASGALALNIVGAAGSGKTMLLEKTLEMLPAHTRAAVLTGDMQTLDEAHRLMRYGYPVRQMINSGRLDASMIEGHLGTWLVRGLQLLLIENVGSMESPDLGEDATVAILSVLEHEDKPLKHPDVFRKAELLIINKIDLLPRLPFQTEAAGANARRINPEIEIIETSCVTGQGLGQWMRWLEARAARKVTAMAAAGS